MFKKKIVFATSCTQLEELFAEHFPELVDYCFVSDQDADNDSTHSFIVDGLRADALLLGSSYNIALDALNILCARQVIEPGEYLVEVSW